MKTSAGLVYLLAALLEPFMPSFSKEVSLLGPAVSSKHPLPAAQYGFNRSRLFYLGNQVLRQLNLPPGSLLSFYDDSGESNIGKKPWQFLPSGLCIGKPVPLFKELVCRFTYSILSPSFSTSICCWSM